MGVSISQVFDWIRSTLSANRNKFGFMMTGPREIIVVTKVRKKSAIEKPEWDAMFDESGLLARTTDSVLWSILERGLDTSVRSEAWKFLCGYYSWRSNREERLVTSTLRRKLYEELCAMFSKILPRLEAQHKDFKEIQYVIDCDLKRLSAGDNDERLFVDKKQLEKILLLSNICNSRAEYQQGFHEMMMLFQLMMEQEYEMFWMFQFFLQKTDHSCVMNIGVNRNLGLLKDVIGILDPPFSLHMNRKCPGPLDFLFPWFCLFFQRTFKHADDVWRLWEVFLTRKPCRNFQILIAYSMLQTVRDQIIKKNMNGEEILMACNNITDLNADELIFSACCAYATLAARTIPAHIRIDFTESTERQ